MTAVAAKQTDIPGATACLYVAPAGELRSKGDLIRPASYSNAKMRVQSRFMLITVQPFFFASS